MIFQDIKSKNKLSYRSTSISFDKLKGLKFMGGILYFVVFNALGKDPSGTKGLDVSSQNNSKGFFSHPMTQTPNYIRNSYL